MNFGIMDFNRKLLTCSLLATKLFGTEIFLNLYAASENDWKACDFVRLVLLYSQWECNEIVGELFHLFIPIFRINTLNRINIHSNLPILVWRNYTPLPFVNWNINLFKSKTFFLTIRIDPNPLNSNKKPNQTLSSLLKQ